MSWRTFCGKRISWKCFIFNIVSRLWMENWDFWRKNYKIMADLSEINSRFPAEPSTWNHLFLQKDVVFLFPDIKLKSLGPVTKDIKRICRNCFLRLQKYNSGEVFQKNIIFSFLFFTEKFPQFWRNCSVRKLSAFLENNSTGLNCFLHVKGKILRKRSCVKQLHFHDCFRILDEMFCFFWQKRFGRVLKTTFQISKGTFCEMINVFERIYSTFFSDMRRNSLGHLATNVWQGLQICSLRVQRNILMKNRFFYGNFFWNTSRTFWRKCLGFQQKIISRFAQTTFQMSRRTLGAKKVLKSNISANLFRLWSESFRTFRVKISAGF